MSYRPGCPGAGGVGWWVIFRTLRTAQWTRASCNHLFWISALIHVHRSSSSWVRPGGGCGCGGWAWVLCVVKLLRAHGGCLGTRSR